MAFEKVIQWLFTFYKSLEMKSLYKTFSVCYLLTFHSVHAINHQVRRPVLKGVKGILFKRFLAKVVAL
jgi:hypothetical protein